MRRDPRHRSSPSTLRRLAVDNVYWFLGAERADVIGQLPLANLGLVVTALLARRYGASRVAAAEELAREARRALGIGSLAGWTASERQAFSRWAPLVLSLPGLRRWSEADRAALAAVAKAKGGRRESEFVLRFDAHARLRAALRGLAERNAP
jgi:hypothetical protein